MVEFFVRASAGGSTLPSSAMPKSQKWRGQVVVRSAALPSLSIPAIENARDEGVHCKAIFVAVG
jgi:hypothetical protein